MPCDRNKKRFFALLFALGGLFLVPAVSSAAYEISDGSVKALYHFNGSSADQTGSYNGSDNSMGYPAGLLGSGSAYFSVLGSGIDVGAGAIGGITTGPMTIGAWIKTSCGSAFNAEWGDYQGGAGAFDSVLVHNDGNVEFEVYNGSAADDLSSSGLNVCNNAWHFIVAMRDGSNLKIYIDGADHSSGAVADNGRNIQPSNGVHEYWGRNPLIGANAQMYGYFDESFILNRALTPTEITALYNSGTGQEICLTSGCAGGGPTPPPPSSTSTVIEFYQPNPSLTSVHDFKSWITSSTNTTTTLYETQQIVIHYSTSSALTGGFYDYFGPFNASIINTGTSSLAIIQKTRTLLTGETWYAQAEIDGLVFPDGAGPPSVHPLATSSIESWTIDSPYYPPGSLLNPTSTSPCNVSDSWFSQGICNVGVFLFYPQIGDLSNWSDLKTAIENKPPFGYFASAFGVINSLSTTTATTTGMADLSSLSTPFFNPFKNALIIALDIMFSFWVVHKITHFKP